MTTLDQHHDIDNTCQVTIAATLKEVAVTDKDVLGHFLPQNHKVVIFCNASMFV